jgi:hypothetical protein
MNASAASDSVAGSAWSAATGRCAGATESAVDSLASGAAAPSSCGLSAVTSASAAAQVTTHMVARISWQHMLGMLDAWPTDCHLMQTWLWRLRAIVLQQLWQPVQQLLQDALRVAMTVVGHRKPSDVLLSC